MVGVAYRKLVHTMANHIVLCCVVILFFMCVWHARLFFTGASQVTEYEKHTALFSGDDGMDTIRDILRIAPHLLGGWFVCNPHCCTSRGARACAIRATSRRARGSSCRLLLFYVCVGMLAAEGIRSPPAL